MTDEQRKELLKLVDAVCEGTADREQFARLEKLALTSRGGLRLYLDAMELHGLLAWDAAGIGVLPERELHEPDPTELASHELAALPRKARRNRQPTWSLVLAGITAAIVLMAVGLGRFDRTVEPLEPVAEEVRPSPSPSETGLAAHQGQLPEVKLPTIPVERPPASLTGEASSVIANALPPRLEAASDDEVVRFIDSQLARTWETNDVQPSPLADDQEWVRRVHLDLAGRIPTMAEVEAFLQDERQDKRRRLVDTLLESRDFAANYATHWTNLLVGRARNGEVDRFALMSWLEYQFGENRSWRETVTDLITAEGPVRENGPANFLVAHLNNEAVPATAITARILLCEQIQCAQCHRHPHAASWDQNRFWELNAFFQQVALDERNVVDQETGERERIRELVDRPVGGESFYETLKGVMQVAYPKYGDVEIPFSEQTPFEEQVPLRQRLAELLCAGNRPQVARAFINRSWHHLFGYGFTNPVDDMGPHHLPSHPELLDGLTDAFVQNQFDVKRLIRWICLSRAYQLSSRPVPTNVVDAPEAGERPLFSRMYVKPLSAEQVYDSLLVASGVSPAELRRQLGSFQEREDWLQQFFTAVETEENSELTTLDGSLTQTLMMMNGELIERATHPEQGRVLHRLLVGSNLSESEKIRRLSLAALSRYPTNDEVVAIRQVLRKHVKHRTDHNVPPQLAVNEGFRDIYWAYLNSSEFIVNR